VEPRIRPGDRVATADLGEGVVVEVLGDRANVTLEDVNNLVIGYSLSDLRRLQPSVPDITVEDIQPSLRCGAGDSFERSLIRFRRAIDALRFGLVPVDVLEEVTIGYSTLQNWVLGRLPDKHRGAATFSEVSGPFGSGKSHAMAIVRHVAQKAGYVTAHVQIDGKLVSLSDPKKLLEELWRTLSFDGGTSTTPLLDLYEKAINSGKRAPTTTSEPIDRIGDNYRMVQLLARSGQLRKYAADLDGVISCSADVRVSDLSTEISREPNINRFDVKIRPMIGRAITDRPRDLVQSLAGHATVAELAGFPGLVVTIDEFEIEHFEPKRLERTVAAVVALNNYLAGASTYPPAPLGLFVASVGQAGHVGDRVLECIVKNTGGDLHYLRELTESDLQDLAGRIHQIYCRAYKVYEPLPADQMQAVLECARRSDKSDSGFIRTFIKGFVARCDAAFGPPGNDCVF